MKLTATFIPEGDMGYTGWINEIAGVTAFGETIEKAQEQLLRVLEVKFNAERRRAEEQVKNNEKIIRKELMLNESGQTVYTNALGTI